MWQTLWLVLQIGTPSKNKNLKAETALISLILLLWSHLSPGTNLTHTGSLLGAGCCGTLEFLLNVRHKVGGRPRGGVRRALCGGRASLKDWLFKAFHSLIKFSLTWGVKMSMEKCSNINSSKMTFLEATSWECFLAPSFLLIPNSHILLTFSFIIQLYSATCQKNPQQSMFLTVRLPVAQIITLEWHNSLSLVLKLMFVL